MEGESFLLQSGTLQERFVLAVVEVAGLYLLAQTIWEYEVLILPEFAKRSLTSFCRSLWALRAATALLFRVLTYDLLCS